MKPINDRLIVKMPEVMEKTAGGLFLPDTAKEKPLEGEVVAVGSKVKQVKVGDTVLYGEYAGQTFDVGGQEFLIVREDEVFLIKV